MKKTILTLTLLCILAGCSEYEPPAIYVKLQESGGPPVKVDLESPEEPLNVSIESEPMRVAIDSNSIPVTIDHTVPFTVNIDAEKFLWPAVATAAVIFILALSSLISAIASLRLSRTAKRTLKKLKGKD